MSIPPDLKNLAYPLAQNAASLRTASGRSLEELDIEAICNGKVSAGDLRIQGDTLQAQAEIARQAGFDRVAENLHRAAELARVPNDELLRMYEALRPGRSTYDQLISLAEELEHRFQAPRTGRFFREAAEVYRQRNLLK